jgi:hypothetical protein
MAAFSPFAALMGACIALGAAGQQPAAPARPGAGEIIVKFSPNSRADAEVVRAATESDVPSAAVESQVSSLGRELGVPLDAKRLGSGGTVIVALQDAELPEAIAKRIRQAKFVQNVRIAAKSEGVPTNIEVELASDSAEASTLKQRTSDDEQSAAVKSIADKLERASGLPLKGVVDASGRLVLTIEVDAAIDQLVARLNKRPGIQYAQPNRSYRVQSPGIR